MIVLSSLSSNIKNKLLVEKNFEQGKLSNTLDQICINDDSVVFDVKCDNSLIKNFGLSDHIPIFLGVVEDFRENALVGLPLCCSIFKFVYKLFGLYADTVLVGGWGAMVAPEH